MKELLRAFFLGIVEAGIVWAQIEIEGVVWREKVKKRDVAGGSRTGERDTKDMRENSCAVGCSWIELLIQVTWRSVVW